MLNKISMKLSTELLRRVDKARYSQDVYVYGVEIILSTLLEIVTILVSAALVSAVEAGVIFIVLFSSLRIFTGGYHAETYRKCFVVTVSSFWGAFLIANIISSIFANEVLYFLLLLVVIYIIARAPILNENQPLSNVKVVKNGKMATITLMIHLVLISRFLQYNEKMMNMAIVTISLVAVYMLITDINKIKGGTKDGNYCKIN